jgi:transketolase
MEAAATTRHASVRLRYVPLAELTAIRAMDDPIARAAAFADACRVNALSAIMEAGSGHVGTSFSVLDLLSWLHLSVLDDGDLCFSSKGHDAPATYAVLAGTGKLDFGLLHRLRRLDGLPGHPDIEAAPALVTNTGSLGMGISKAKGLARAARVAGDRRRVFVITGDGELQEGQFWESLGQASNEGFHELTAIVDHNKLQSDTWVEFVNDLGDLEAKVAAFGWATARCDGNDVAQVAAALDGLLTEAHDRPKLLIADTVKGAGTRVFEPTELERSGTALYPFHSGAPPPELYDEALTELLGRLRERLGREPAVEDALTRAREAPAEPQRLVAAYGDALAAAGEREPRLVVFDADLYLDTGLIPFRERFPERFVECGIAEQDMVSQAGGLARAGLLPAVHSFACFLTPRANEQIFNNATEQSHIVYTGSLAGLVPGGPGHSHQSVRDIALMSSVPGMVCLEPATEPEVRLCVDWAVHTASGPVYIRLVSVPWELGFRPPEPQRLEVGRGTVVRNGDRVLVVCAGPVLLSQAWTAAERVGEVGIVSLPWLSDVDGAWLAAVAGSRPIVCLDNHLADCGQGAAVLAALTRAGHAGGVILHGVTEVPVCGRDDEVLAHHRLDPDGIAAVLEDAS